MEENFFDPLAKIDLKAYDNIKKLQLFKEMITRLVVC